MSPETQALPRTAAATPAQAPHRAGPAARRGPAESRALRRLFWLAVAGLLCLVGFNAAKQTLEGVCGAVLIIALALAPSYLWITGRVRGLPLFPVCALSCIWTFALPLVSEHPVVGLFPGWNQLVAALTVAGFLLAGTVSWYLAARRPPRPPEICWMMDEVRSGPLLLFALSLCAAWSVVYAAGWVHLSIGVDSLTRAVTTAIEAMTCFVLSYRLGRGKLAGTVKGIFFVSLGVVLVVDVTGLLLIVAMSLSAISMIAYVVASKQLPWRVGLVAMCLFGFLHIGKTAMREKHWHGDELSVITPLQYPGFVAEWFATSLETIRHGSESDEQGESLLERASLMHLLLYIQLNSPSPVPYLSGATYAVIPRMFLPRILDPDKPRSHEATYMISIHYGIQTREDTETTTIAFGLLNEAYANFGFLGIGALGVTLGVFYGKVAQWARKMPILSFRALFAMLIASYSFEAEWTSTFYVAALFQSTVVLLAVTAVFMRPRRISAMHNSLLD